jgi:hypothetical protein
MAESNTELRDYLTIYPNSVFIKKTPPDMDRGDMSDFALIININNYTKKMTIRWNDDDEDTTYEINFYDINYRLFKKTIPTVEGIKKKKSKKKKSKKKKSIKRKKRKSQKK